MRDTESRKMAAIAYPATVQVSRPDHLCSVQIATRRFCQAIDFNAGAVLDAVNGVSELAHRILINIPRSGAVRLSAVKMNYGYALEAQVTHVDSVLGDASGDASQVISMTFPPWK